ncbi:hypothetical protein PG990_013037 [Apiospora arundinis]
MPYQTSSRSSSGSEVYRSGQSSTHKKEASSRSADGPVVVHHHARIHEPNAPRPGYSNTASRSSGGGSSRR